MSGILRDLFGAGTWGVAGNLIASALTTVPAVIIAHLKARKHREQQQAELKQHVTDTARPESEAK